MNYVQQRHNTKDINNLKNRLNVNNNSLELKYKRNKLIQLLKYKIETDKLDDVNILVHENADSTPLNKIDKNITLLEYDHDNAEKMMCNSLRRDYVNRTIVQLYNSLPDDLFLIQIDWKYLKIFYIDYTTGKRDLLFISDGSKIFDTRGKKKELVPDNPIHLITDEILKEYEELEGIFQMYNTTPVLIHTVLYSNRTNKNVYDFHEILEEHQFAHFGYYLHYMIFKSIISKSERVRPPNNDIKIINSMYYYLDTNPVIGYLASRSDENFVLYYDDIYNTISLYKKFGDSDNEENGDLSSKWIKEIDVLHPDDFI